MSDLTDFLLARIAEDESAAKQVAWGEVIPSDCWGPDRVLAECAAKRQIVELHGGDYDGECQSPARLDGPCRTLRALAAPFADHPDCRAEWAL